MEYNINSGTNGYPRIGISGHPLLAIPPIGYGAMEKILFKRALLLAEKGLEAHIISRPRFSPSRLNLRALMDNKLLEKRNLFLHYCTFHRYILYYTLAKLGKDEFYKYIANEMIRNSINLAHITYPEYTSRLRYILGDEVKIVVELTTTSDEKSFKRLASLSREADLILCLSDFINQRTRVYVNKPIETIHCAVDFDLYIPQEKENIILYVGKIMKEKGLHVLIEAIKNINLGDWKVYVVGFPVDPQYYKMCRKNALDKVKFFGYLSPDSRAIVNLYSKAAIFVCPSIWFEAFGVVNLEAMSSECAVIASKIGGIPEIIQDNKNGILVEPNNPLALADALSLLIDDECLRKELGKKARMRVLEKFDYGRHVERLLQIYRKYDLI